MKRKTRKSVIGLALGSGSARGWSHIGVIRELEKRGIKPDIVCGTSVGSIVAAAYASNQLDDLEAWVKTLEWRDVVGFMDLNFGGGGIFKGKKLFDYMKERFGESDIESLDRKFGAIATDVDSGLEVWLKEGKLLSAVRASISLPAIFTPVYRDDRWLVDGGLVNPVPVSLCRAMGADFIIAVDLNSDLLDGTKSPEEIARIQSEEEEKIQEESERDKKKEANGNSEKNPGGDEPGTQTEEGEQSEPNESQGEKEPSFWTAAKNRITSGFWGSEIKESLDNEKEKDERPSMIEMIAKSIDIMQIRITRSRMAGDPPDVLIRPRLGYMGLMEFHRAKEAIEEGKNAVERVDAMLKR